MKPRRTRPFIRVVVLRAVNSLGFGFGFGFRRHRLHPKARTKDNRDTRKLPVSSVSLITPPKTLRPACKTASAVIVLCFKRQSSLFSPLQLKRKHDFFKPSLCFCNPIKCKCIYRRRREVVGFASLELSVCGLRNMHSVDFECGV